MLEVVFSDSTKGSMGLAKNYDENSMLKGAFGYIGKKPSKKELKKMFEGKAVGGSPKDVVDIGFLLDVGDISGELVGVERQNVLKRVWGRFGIKDVEIKEICEKHLKDIEKLITAAKSGESIRIWASDAPYSACGLHCVCNLLIDIDCSLSVVYLPQHWQTSEKEMTSYSSWGEVEPGKFYQFLPLEKPITSLEKRILGNHWRTLMSENAPLRAKVNGKLMSVPENFYDHLIIQNLPDGEFLMGELIGRILAKYPIGIGDSLIASRIDKMIEDNKLIVVRDEDKEHPYGKILRTV